MGAKRTTKYGVTGYADKSNYNVYKIRCRECLMKYIDDLKKLRNQLSSLKKLKEFNSNNQKNKSILENNRDLIVSIILF